MHKPFLIRIKTSHRRCIIHLNSTSLLLVCIPERQRPTTLANGSGEPETHQVTLGLAALGREIGILGSRM